MPARSKSPADIPVLEGFDEILSLIQAARQRAFQSVNVELIDLYWQVGQTVSQKIEAAEWGDGVVDQLATYLARTQPGLKGFSRQNIFRMRQFYEIYRDHAKVSALLRQLPWTHNLSNPSIGLLLCASRDHEVVEYALRRSLSPALIANYQTLLPDKKLLQAKLHEFYQLAISESTNP